MGGGHGGGAATRAGAGAPGGVGEGRAVLAGNRSPFPVRTAPLFPNLPLSAPSRPGKAPGRLTAVPRCADRRACRDRGAPAGTGPSAPGQPTPSGKAGAAPGLCTSAPQPQPLPDSSISVGFFSPVLEGLQGPQPPGGLLPSSFMSFSYLFLFNNEFLMTQAIN